MSIVKRALTGALLGLLLTALAMGSALAHGKAIQFSTQSEKARQLIDDITNGIESFQTGPALAAMAQELVEADPEWGFGYMVLSQFQPTAQGQESMKKAQELSAHLNEAEKQYMEGVIAIRSQDVPKALGIFQALAKEYPGERRAHMLVGQLEMALGNIEKSQEALETSFKLSSSTPRVYAFLGNCHLVQGRYSKAGKLYDKGIAMADPDTFPFGLYFGQIFSQVHQRNVDTALAKVDLALEKYIETGGAQNFPPVFFYNLRGRINLENGRLEAAMKDYEKGLKVVEGAESLPDQQKQIWTGRYQHGRARTLAKMGKHEQAWAIAEEMKKQIDENGDVGAQFVPVYHYLAGYIKLEAGEYEKAIEHLVNATPTDPFHRILLARAYLKAGQKDKAKEVYEEVAGVNQVSMERSLAYPEAKEMLEKLGG